MDIEDMHPMRTKAKLDIIYPFLRVFRRCRRNQQPDFRHGLRKTLLEEMDIKIPKSETQLIKEPFLMLGYGVNAYFDMLYSLMWMCIICSFACIPLYKFYSYNDGMGMQLYLGGDSTKLFF